MCQRGRLYAIAIHADVGKGVPVVGGLYSQIKVGCGVLQRREHSLLELLRPVIERACAKVGSEELRRAV